MSIKSNIPNFISLLNLLCGAIAVIFAVHNNFVATAVFVFLGIFFDFFDGFFARLLKVQSPLGVQLDSLADMVTSGLVPGIVMFKLLVLSIDSPSFAEQTDVWNAATHWTIFKGSLLPLFGLCITLASAYRLAKFNIDDEQQSYFKGLPTPANTLLIISLPLIVEFQNNDIMNALILNTWVLLGLTVVSSYLLNSPIKLFALKFKDWSFKSNAVRYVFLLLSIVLLIVLQFAAIPIIIICYIVFSLFSQSLISK